MISNNSAIVENIKTQTEIFKGFSASGLLRTELQYSTVGYFYAPISQCFTLQVEEQQARSAVAVIIGIFVAWLGGRGRR